MASIFEFFNSRPDLNSLFSGMPANQRLTTIKGLVKDVVELGGSQQGLNSPDFQRVSSSLRDVSPELYDRLKQTNWGASTPSTGGQGSTTPPDKLLDPNVVNVDPRISIPGTGGTGDTYISDPNLNIPNLPGHIRPVTDEFLEFIDKPTRTNPLPIRYLPTEQQDWATNPALLSFLGDQVPVDTSRADADFDALIGNINAPSSVDQVQSEIESDLMKQLLETIDRDTAGEAANLKLDFLDRGLGGPGQISDIEAIGLAQVGAEGGRKKASARSNYALAELGRVKAREEAAREAFSTRYKAGVNREQQLIGTRNQRDLALAQALLQLELDRLGRKAGKYQPGSMSGGSGGGDWYDLLLSGVGTGLGSAIGGPVGGAIGSQIGKLF